MVLNNMKRYLKMLHLIGGLHYSQSYDFSVNMPEAIKTTDGKERTTFQVPGRETTTYVSNTYPFTSFSNSIMTKETNGSDTSTTIMFGGGDVAVTENDYMLANAITSGLKIIDISSTCELNVSEDGNIFMKVTTLNFALNNTSTSPITVKEVGFYQNFWHTGTNTKTTLLLHREVFDPVTIGAGAYGSFIFNFEVTNSIA